jgi:methyltransferase
VTWLSVVLVLVVIQRLFELWLAACNTRRLKAAGAVEFGAGHYPLFILLHGGWLAAIALLTPWNALPEAWLLGLYLLLQIARVWIIVTLGPFWTTRIVSLPGAPLVRTGPYRFLRHPNYWVASAEIAVLPLAFGQVGVAAAFSVLNAGLIAWRVRVETRALSPAASRRPPDGSSGGGGLHRHVHRRHRRQGSHDRHQGQERQGEEGFHH